MNLSPSRYNKFDCQVQEVQVMLNNIKEKFNHSWEKLDNDGIYWIKTEGVIKKFQRYYNVSSKISSAGIMLDDNTVSKIKQVYNTQPMIIQAVPPIKPDEKGPFYSVAKFRDDIIGCLATIDSLAESLLDAKKMVIGGNIVNPGLGGFRDIISRLEPKADAIRKNLSKLLDGNPRSVKQQNKIKSKIFKSQKESIEFLRKLNITGKINNALRANGVIGEIKIGSLKVKPNVQFKGGGILALWQFKDIGSDLLRFNEYGSTKWKEDVEKHFKELIDSLIVGFVATLLAEFAVVGIAAAAGVTISAGWIVLIIAVVGAILATVILFIMDCCDFTFVDFAMEVYRAIVPPSPETGTV